MPSCLLKPALLCLTLLLLGCQSWRQQDPWSPTTAPAPLAQDPPLMPTPEQKHNSQDYMQENIPLPLSMWSPSRRRSQSYMHMLQGHLLQLQGYIDDALQHYEAGYVLTPNAFIGSQVVAARFQIGDHSGSLKEAHKMTLLYPRSSNLRVLYGKMLLSHRRVPEAWRQLKEALRLSETEEEAYMLLGESLLWQKKHQEAEQIALRYIEHIPGSVHGWVVLVQARSQMGDLKEALSAAQHAHKVFPHSLPITLAYAYLSAGLGDTQRSLALYSSIHKKISYDFKRMQDLAAFYETLGGLDEAYRTLDALTTGPAASEAYLPLEQEKLWILLRRKSYTEAIALAASLYERFPTDDGVLFSLALTYLRAGQSRKALEFWSLTHRHSPYFSISLMQAARLARELGELQQGIALVERLLAWGGDPKEGLIFAAWYYRDLKLHDAALSLVRQGKHLYPEDPQLYLLQAHLYYDLHRKDAVEQTLNELIEKYPQNHIALNFLGYFYIEQGINLQRAEKLVRRALKQKPRSAAYLDSLGWLYFQKQQWQQAEGYLRRALSYDPTDGLINEHMAQLLLQGRACSEALRYFRRALADKQLEEEDRRRITQRLNQAQRKSTEMCSEETHEHEEE